MSSSQLAQNGVSTDLDDNPPKQSSSQKVANVWDLRKEQMARTKAAAASPNALKTSSQTPNHQPILSHLSPTSNNTTINGHIDDPFNDDPFVVRPGRTGQMARAASMRLDSSEIRPKASMFPSASASPVAEREDWPEVSKSRSTGGEPIRASSHQVDHSPLKLMKERRGKFFSFIRPTFFRFGTFYRVINLFVLTCQLMVGAFFRVFGSHSPPLASYYILSCIDSAGLTVRTC